MPRRTEEIYGVSVILLGVIYSDRRVLVLFDSFLRHLKIYPTHDDVVISLIHDGGGKAQIDPTEAAKIIAKNIREGITVLGVTGTMSGTEEVVAESPTVTPAVTSKVVTPSEGYNYLAQVTVEAIPYSETDNSAGGKTVTIA